MIGVINELIIAYQHGRTKCTPGELHWNLNNSDNVRQHSYCLKSLFWNPNFVPLRPLRGRNPCYSRGISATNMKIHKKCSTVAAIWLVINCITHSHLFQFCCHQVSDHLPQLSCNATSASNFDQNLHFLDFFCRSGICNEQYHIWKTAYQSTLGKLWIERVLEDHDYEWQNSAVNVDLWAQIQLSPPDAPLTQDVPFGEPRLMWADRTWYCYSSQNANCGLAWS